MHKLNQCSDCVATVASVTSKAIANSRGIVALSTAAALEGIEVRQLQLSDVLCLGLQGQAGELGSAAIAADEVLDGEQVLRTLHVVTNEGNVDDDIIADESVRAVDLDLVNDAVGQLHEGLLDVDHKVMEGCTVVDDWSCGKGLVKSTLEGNAKGITIQGKIIGDKIRSEMKLLHLIFGGGILVISNVHDVSSIWAHTLGAINVTIFSIANTSACLGHVPIVVSKCLHVLSECRGWVIIRNRLESKILDVSTLPVTRTITWARSTLAAFAFISWKTFAVAGVAIANTLGSTFGIFMVVSNFVRSVNPSKFIRANALRAITAVMRKTQAPVVITSTLAVNIASSMTRTSIVTFSVCDSEKRE